MGGESPNKYLSRKKSISVMRNNNSLGDG